MLQTGIEMTPSTEDLDPSTSAPDDVTQATYVTHGTGKGLLRLCVVIGLVLGLGFFFVYRGKSEAEARLVDATSKDAAEAPAVDVFTVSPSTAKQSLRLPGETAAWNETAIYARVNGYVVKWFVDIGDSVTTGQTLAVMDTPELDAELLAAKAKLNASIAQVAVKEARAEFAATTDKRWRESPQGVVSDQERESKKAGSAEAIAELNAARAQVMLENAEVDRLSALTQFKEVKAPFDGTIIQRHIDVGNLVTAGSAGNTTSLYQLTQNNPIRIFVHAPQVVAAQLMRPGVNAVITSSGQPNLRIEGKVARTAKAINPRTRTIRVEIDIPNPDRSLVPGMYIQAEFELPGGGLIQIPAAALLYRSGGPQVAVIDDTGAVDFRDVTIASDDGNVVAIDSGLAIGDKVALNLSSQIAAGEKVKTGAGDIKSASVQ
jgi:RND family efflux transporter MFP subunit